MGFAEYEKYDGLGLAELVARREVSAEELLDAALERVERRNPKLNAVILLCVDRARAAIQAGLPDGRFRGVPFLLKDLHATLTGERITFGSRIYKDFVADHDAEISARYKRAGLVIFGRTTSPEFGLTGTTESLLWGKTRNPWSLELSSGGSSGGAASAVAAGILPVAHASDGGGSIRIPATCCGLFGLKPTRARVPSGPDVGEGWGGMSTAHVVSRSVRDSAALLDATAGPDLGAPYWAERPPRPWLSEVSAAPGRLRIALQTRPWNDAPVHADCRTAAEDAARLCASLGHDVEPAEIEIDGQTLGDAVQVIIGANTLATVEDRARALGREFTPDDIEPITYGMAVRARENGAAAYARAIRVVHATGRAVARFFERYDLLLTPTMATPPLPLGRIALDRADIGGYIADISQVVGFTSLFNVAGNPAVSVPLHWNAAGLPIGVQFAARYGDEATLFRLGAQLEVARPWRDRRPPSL